MSLQSALYTGTLQHRRIAPKAHYFRYQVALFYLDLSEIEQIFNRPFLFSWKGPSLCGFRRKDYLKGEPSLDQTVRNIILEKTGKTHVGPIRMLTQIRYFGFCFNPVTFYYCFDPMERLRFFVAEITNTPWNERHSYVFQVNPEEAKNRFEFKKDFHVSPFLPMDLHYIWQINSPAPKAPEQFLTVQMEDWDLKSKQRVFDAHLSVKAKPLTGKNLAALVGSFPLLTLKTFLAIYYQAFLLKFFKNAHFYSHPQSGEKP